MHENEVIISHNKIIKNIKKFWWVSLVSVLLAVVVSITASVRSKKQTDSMNENQYYQAFAVVNVNWKDFSEEVDVSNLSEYEKSMVETNYDKKHTDILNELKSSMSWDETIQEINRQLIDHGYESLTTTDTFGMGVVSKKNFSITVSGLKDENRINCLANTVMNLMMQRLQNEYGSDICIIQQEPVVYKATKNGSTIVRYYEQSEETQSTGFINKSIVIGIAFAFIVYIIAIFILSMLDKKVDSPKEIEHFMRVPYFGELKKRNEDILFATIMAKCMVAEYHNILIVTPMMVSDQISDKVNELVSYLSKQNIHSGFSTAVCSNIGTIEELNKVDGVLIVVQKNNDTVENVKQTMNLLDTVESNVIGYIFI